MRKTLTQRVQVNVQGTVQGVGFRPFVYALALEARGVADLSTHVGVEPSGEAFNEASFDGGRPMNSRCT